jgi:hypothetical protein
VRLLEVKGIRGVHYRLGVLQQRINFAARGTINFCRINNAQKPDRPRIACVVVGRNDDYMADFRERLYATLEWNFRYMVSEAIFVEWNPTPGRELLALGLAKHFKALRAYVVPPAVHQEICQNSAVKVLEYHAKNVGIRRAQAPWILATNADAAVGLDTVNTIRNWDSDPEVAWIADRIDIPWAENQQQAIGFLGTLRYKRLIPHSDLGTGEFALASRELWHRARGYDEQMVSHRIGCDIRGIAQMQAVGAHVKTAGIVLHLTHPTSCTEGIRPHHGELATTESLPYLNHDNWGLAGLREVELAERVWQLE